ncbi:MAG TPA: hypothetical protein VD978_20335 [Azospirillum sp.]|nr:hypothetical protein [Azospirillum sp.]
MQDDVDRMRAVGAANASRMSALNSLAMHLMARLGADESVLDQWRKGWDRGDLSTLDSALREVMSRAKPPGRG